MVQSHYHRVHFCLYFVSQEVIQQKLIIQQTLWHANDSYHLTRLYTSNKGSTMFSVQQINQVYQIINFGYNISRL